MPFEFWQLLDVQLSVIVGLPFDYFDRTQTLHDVDICYCTAGLYLSPFWLPNANSHPPLCRVYRIYRACFGSPLYGDLLRCSSTALRARCVRMYYSWQASHEPPNRRHSVVCLFIIPTWIFSISLFNVLQAFWHHPEVWEVSECVKRQGCWTSQSVFAPRWLTYLKLSKEMRIYSYTITWLTEGRETLRSDGRIWTLFRTVPYRTALQFTAILVKLIPHIAQQLLPYCWSYRWPPTYDDCMVPRCRGREPPWIEVVFLLGLIHTACIRGR